MPATVLHPFEASGLGLAPFRLVSVTRSGMRGCAHCGTGIAVHCLIESRDGKRFVVGSTCVSKTSMAVDTSLALDVRKALAELKYQEREAKAAPIREARAARVRAARQELEGDADLFSAEPHPNAYFARQGLKLRDWMLWQLRFAGEKTRDQICSTVETATAQAGAQ